MAVGGEWGTLSEIALARKIGRPVALLGEPPARGDGFAGRGGSCGGGGLGDSGCRAWAWGGALSRNLPACGDYHDSTII